MAGAFLVAAMWWIGFEEDARIPLLTWVNLGVHEAGHLLTHSFSPVVTAMMGSIAQVGVPLLLAGYFLIRGDWVGAGVCLAWGATSALEVAVYVADAPTRRLALIGSSHDWAFILGPDGYDALDRARPLAETIREWASIAVYTGFALCLAAPLASARRATEASSAWAASPTSGRAPRSASRPK
jgi:hypothetical protein